MERLTPHQKLAIALAHHRAGRAGAAADVCEQILRADPDDADALHLRGVIAHAAGQRELAVKCLAAAARLRPASAEVAHNLGAALLAHRQFESAVAALRRALELAPNEAAQSAAMLQLGAALLGQGSLDEAVAVLREAAERRPDDADAWNNLGVALFRRGESAAAIEAFDRTLAIRPDAAAAHKNRGMALRLALRREEAIAAFQRAAALAPADHDAENNLGVTFEHMRQWERAIHHYRRSVALRPDDGAPQWNLARLLLLTADKPFGDFEQGWRLFDARLRMPYLKLARPFPQPHWTGQPIAGKTLLLWTEGGFGDALHFIRYVPQIAERGATVLLECQPELASLLGRVLGISAVIRRGEPLPACDFQCPLQSLPRAMRTTLASIPATVPYLAAEQSAVERWRDRLAGDRGLRIGLAWAGSINPDDIRSRSLAVFAPLAAVAGVTFYSLQKGREADQPAPAGMRLIRPLEPGSDFADSAALVRNLDGVITVDTSVGHLAGAVGVASWILVPYHPDFRWMLDRPDSPWYPTVRLFRQRSEDGDWVVPVREMAEALEEMVRKRRVRG